MSLFQSDAGGILKAFVDSPVQEQTVLVLSPLPPSVSHVFSP